MSVFSSLCPSAQTGDEGKRNLRFVNNCDLLHRCSPVDLSPDAQASPQARAKAWMTPSLHTTQGAIGNRCDCAIVCDAGQPHFDTLRALLRKTGGLARSDDLGRLLEDRQLGDFVSLARLIASGDVFGFE